MKKLFLIMLVLLAFSNVTKAQQNSLDVPQDGEIYYKKSEVDKAVIIRSKPIAETDQTCTENPLRVSVKVYFHKSGQVSFAKLVTPSSCKYFNKSSVDAAYRIKFLPAMKSGQAVSSTTLFENTFSKY